MSEQNGKTPYEIRLELLKLARQYVSDNYAQQEYWVEKQATILQDMIQMMNKETVVQMDSFNENYDKAMADLKGLMGSIPTQDDILEAARKFQEFVNLKK